MSKKAVSNEVSVSFRVACTTAFLEGFTVILLELACAKIISAYYGSTFAAWNIVLCLTFAFLAIGYYLGSRRAVKGDFKQTISTLLIWTAVLSLLQLLLANQLFKSLSGFGFFGGLVISSTLILGPALVVVGMVNALLIQSQFHAGITQGKTSGLIFGISTLGGIVSVFVSGLLLLPLTGISITILISALILIALVFISFRPVKNKFVIAVVVVTILLGFYYNLTSVKHKTSDSFVVQYESEGILGQLKVLDYQPPGQNFNVRKLLINGIPQTYILNRPEALSFWKYPHFIAGFSSMKDTSARCLLVGFGGGSVARELLKLKFKVDVVELDPRVINVANDFFYIDTSKFEITIDDIRHYAKVSDKKYDLIVLDVLSGEVQPSNVFTVEAMQDFKRILNPSALMVVNYQGILNDEEDKSFPTLYCTFLKSGFETRYWATNPDEFDDIIFHLSLNGGKDLKPDTSRFSECCKAEPLIGRFIQQPFGPVKKEWESFPVLTDDKPVLELLNSRAMIKWRQTMLKDITNEELKEGIRIFK